LGVAMGKGRAGKNGRHHSAGIGCEAFAVMDGAGAEPRNLMLIGLS